MSPSLHNQIMNLVPEKLLGTEGNEPSPVFAFNTGHKCARHTAAELALKADAERAELIELVQRIATAFRPDSEIRNEVDALTARINP